MAACVRAGRLGGPDRTRERKAASGQGEVGVARLHRRRGQPARYLRHEARCSGGDSRRVTRVPGTRLCEYLPRLAQMADRYALVRSVSHDDVDHGSASYLALTGQFHLRRSSNPPVRSTDFPTYGAILRRVRPTSHFPYTALHLNGPLLTPREA